MPQKRTTTRERSGAARTTGPGGRAVGGDAALKASNITRLKRAEGQVRGVARMVAEDRYCADIIIQIAAAQESLRAVAKNLLKNHLKHCAKAALKAGEAEADAMCNELMDVMGKIAR
ncbi:MAG: metal-sensitive transcriptional regulator [Phycisphaerae bacterium]|nr:metal-sensitive transcriptional regulator [Phycisphaerae bacterium]MDZ4831646.1 metal-sensitive transcriptional regulator [Phycisphaerae bacterium]